MNPDDLKEAWQAQTSRTRLTIDADLLIKEVRRNESALSATVFWRDVREVGVSLLMVPGCIFGASKLAWGWTWYLMAAAMFWIAAFMIIDRVRHRRKIAETAESLLVHVESSLCQVEHQIWLLRHVFWWYLLPPGLVFLTMFGRSLWLMRAGGWRMTLGTSAVFAVLALFMAGVYWLNQYGVRAGLEPRRRELQDLLTALQQKD